MKVLIVLLTMMSARGVNALCSGTSPCTCSISASAMNFGSYIFTTGTPTNSTATVTVTCNSGALSALTANYTISASLSVAGNAQRRMIGPSSSQLLYNLYTTNARTTIWADGTVGTATLSGGCSQGCLILCGARTCNESFTIYGGIPAGQTVQAGSYNETVTVTVTY